MVKEEINPSGFASPFIQAYLSTGEEVSLNVVRFAYKYSEKGDDQLDLTLEYSDPSVLDRKEFQEDVQWKIIWGYIQGKTKTRKVFLRDIDPVFSASGVTIKLSFTDKFAYTKKDKDKAIRENKTLPEVAEEVADKYQMKLKGIDKAYINVEGGLLYQFVDNTFDSATSGFDTLGMEGDGTGIYLESQTTAMDNARSERYHVFAIQPQMLQAGKSTYANLKEMADSEPGIVVEGRDDNLIIRKRNLDQKPVRTFRWQSGTRDVIEFSPESKSRRFQHTAANTVMGGWNKNTKEYLEQLITQAANEDTRLGDLVEGSMGDFDFATPNENSNKAPGNTAPAKTNLVIGNNNIKTSYGVILTEPKKEGEIGSLLIRGDDYSTAAAGQTELALNQKDNNFLEIIARGQTTAIESTSVILPKVGIISQADREETQKDLEDDRAIDEAKKRVGEASFDLNPGKLLAEGDPDIEVGQVISILGVSKKYSGNYYITESLHEITQDGGYTIDCEITRNAKNSTGNDSPTKVSAKDVNAKINKKVDEASSTGTKPPVKAEKSAEPEKPKWHPLAD